MSVTHAPGAGIALPADLRRGRGGTLNVYRAERRKLSSQLAVRLLALVCLLGPFAFAAVLKVQSGSPADDLFGVWVHSSGYALPLVILTFAGSWGFPLMGGIVAGDMFSSEDRYGTWKMVLTRSCTRGQLFAGKLLAAATFLMGLVALAAAASVLAGVVLVGNQPLVNLSGGLFSAGHALGLVLVSWLVCAPPALAFGSLAVLCSVASRNGIIGVLGPAIAALAMQLLLLVGVGISAHTLLVASAFSGWHPLFASHPFYGQLLIGLAVSLLWCVGCLTVSWLVLRRRDFAGSPVGRRQGWAVPVRVALAFAAVITLFALAGNWGPAGVTAARLQESLAPTFNNLTILQQRELGRVVPAGARLGIQPFCSRRGSTPNGPGDWVCTMNVFIPQPGAIPFQQTPVSYDVSVNSDGCYKAQSPPAFVGSQTMRDAQGQSIVNPLYTIYGCVNTLRGF